MMRYKCVIIPFAAYLVSHPAQGQSFPRVSDSDTMIRPVSAAEAVQHIGIKRTHLGISISARRDTYPRDSILAVSQNVAGKWLSQLQAQSSKEIIDGIQLDALGFVAVESGKEEYAKEIIKKRLNTPNISFGDKAFTYLTAVMVFSNEDYPKRLLFAERYMAELSKMGDSAAYWQFHASAKLARAYYSLGRKADVVRHGMYAVRRVPVMPYIDRHRTVFPDAGDYIYGITLEALSDQPNATVRTDSINSILQKAVVAPPRLIAMDSSFYYLSLKYQRILNRFQKVFSLIGTKASPLIAHKWINTSNADSSALQVNNGKIWLIEFGGYADGVSLGAAFALSRIQRLFPDVQVALMVETNGSWANRLIGYDQETDKVASHMSANLRLGYPIGIWQKKHRSPNEEGGTSVEANNPNYASYQLDAFQLWLIDDKGVIRHIWQEYSRDMEYQIEQYIRALNGEKSDSLERSTSLSATY